VILGILTIILLAWVIVRLASVDIPLPVSTAMTGALLGTLIVIFAVIKILTILGDETTIWAWVGLVLAIVIAVGAFQAVQEAGGVETLRAEASNMGSSGQAAPAAAVPTAAAPTAPAAEAPQAPTGTGESAASEATGAASDAPDAASDATRDEPSTERDS
jgi:hypothetical protein